jgi:spore maturation protein CgeB
VPDHGRLGGVERFFEPEREILVARSGAEVAEHLRGSRPRARAHRRARARRALAEHTYAQPRAEFERVLARTRGPRHGRGGREPASGGRREAAADRDPGASITSSWGNGHATTYRGLVRELDARGHDVTFLERDVPWYAEHRDLPERPPYGRTELYADLPDLQRRFGDLVQSAPTP